MSSKYVIRGYHWGYNDETYYPAGSYIHSVFDDEENAVARYQSLEKAHWQEMDLGETDVFFDSQDRETLCKKVNDFVLEKCGKKVFEDVDDTRDSFIPDSLSVEDTMTVLKMAGLQAYKLAKFDEVPQFYAIWFPEDEEYLTIDDECTSALFYEQTRTELEKEADELLEYRWDEEVIDKKGSYAEISDNPTALEKIVIDTKGLSYNDKMQCLKIDTSKPTAVFAVNDLLKQPLFEIKQLSLEEVQEIEKDLGDGEW